MPKRFDAVLFDLDGTLIDSEPIGMRALDIFLTRYGHTPPPGFLHRLVGRRAHDNALLLLEEFGLPLSVEALIAEQRALINAMVEREVALLPGAAALLRTLRERAVPMAVATSSMRSYLTMVCAKFGWGELFDATVTGEEVPNGKPAPDIFLRAAALLGVAAERCLVLEDAPHGVAAGLAAGATVIAIPNTVTQSLEFPAGVQLAPSLAAVLEWLDAD